MLTSITALLRLMFIIILFLSSVSFTYFLQHQERDHLNQLKQEYIPIFKTLYKVYHRYHFNPIFAQKLESTRFKRIDEERLSLNEKTKTLLINHKEDTALLQLLQYDNTYYLYLQRANDTILFQDMQYHPKDNKQIFYMLFTLYILIIFMTYLKITKKVSMLNLLQDKILTLPNENFDFSCCQTDSKDEVSRLGLALKSSAQQLNEIKHSRNVIIQHILFTLPLIQSKSHNSLMLQSIEALKDLLLYKQNALPEKTMFFQELLKHSKEELTSTVEIKNDTDIRLSVHPDSICFAITQLLTLLCNHTSNEKVEINIVDRDLVITTKGEMSVSNWEDLVQQEQLRFEHPYYSLFLTYHVLKLNRYTLKYTYASGNNRFTIPLDRHDI